MNLIQLKDFCLANNVTAIKATNFVSPLLLEDRDLTTIQKTLKGINKAKFKVDIATAIYPLLTKKIITESQLKSYFSCHQ